MDGLRDNDAVNKTGLLAVPESWLTHEVFDFYSWGIWTEIASTVNY